LNPRRRFFDQMAEVWDIRADASRLRRRLTSELPGFRIRSGESILDVGCGTGNLTSELVKSVGPTGRVVALDLSLKMIERARAKERGAPVAWLECDATLAPLRNETFDRVFCFSSWPHFPDPPALAGELWRVLRDGGRLHIWHSIPREAVNQIHRTSDPAVANDDLPPAHLIAELLRRTGFRIDDCRDDEAGLLVSGAKEGD
jgi:ubiquinone/menaquinone biosynthesis C-methylase UbiE